jgi:hypothetical protein
VGLLPKGQAVLDALRKLENPDCNFIEDEYYTYKRMTDSRIKILMIDKKTGERIEMI